MAVPKRRSSPTKVRMRRSHQALSKVRLYPCPKCGQAKLPHSACGNCGTYQGRSVIDVLKKVTKNERKRKENAKNK